jgi:uncharacterized protein
MKLAEFVAYLADAGEWEGAAPVGIATRSSCGDTALHAALWGKDDGAALELLAAGAEVDAPGEEGYTPLNVAVLQDNVALVRALLARGALWDTVSELGFSARQNALASDNAELRALAARGAETP